MQEITYEDWKMLSSEDTDLWRLRANIVKYMKKGYIPLGPPRSFERGGIKRGFDF